MPLSTCICLRWAAEFSLPGFVLSPCKDVPFVWRCSVQHLFMDSGYSFICAPSVLWMLKKYLQFFYLVYSSGNIQRKSFGYKYMLLIIFSMTLKRKKYITTSTSKFISDKQNTLYQLSHRSSIQVNVVCAMPTDYLTIYHFLCTEWQHICQSATTAMAHWHWLWCSQMLGTQ